VLLACGNNSANINQPSSLETLITKDSLSNKVSPETIDPELLKTWDKFKDLAKTKNYSLFKQISVDTVDICHKPYSFSKIPIKCFIEIFDPMLLQRFRDTSYSEYLEKQIEKNNGEIVLHQFQVVKESSAVGAWTMTFDFIKTEYGYKFFGCDSFGGP